MKRIVCMICALAMLLGCHALAEDEVMLEQMFLYRICLNPEIAQQPDFDEANLIWEQPQPNADYQAQLMSFAQPLNIVQEQNGLRFTALRGIAVNDLYALEWTIENISGENRLLGQDWLQVDGEIGAYSAHSLDGAALRPGEVRKGAAAMMLPGLDGETCTLSIGYREYPATETDISGAQSSSAGAVAAEEPTEPRELLCSEVFTVELTSNTEPLLITQQEPVEIAWRDSVLRLESAELSLSGGAFTLLRIFDTEGAAKDNSPWNWDFDMLENSNDAHSTWVKVGGGTLDDEPFRLDDGRYAYRVTKTAEFLNWLPQQLYIVPCADNGDGNYASDWSVAIKLLQ